MERPIALPRLEKKEAIMRRKLLWTSALALVLVGSAGLVAAQQQPPAADAQQRSQQENAQQTPSGKMGKEEPSSHAHTQPQPNAAFVNGALAVPDAPANTDTVPAKFSQKNAGDDQLITTAYTFKTLTGDERRAIYEALKVQQAPATAFNADIGTALPPEIALHPVPDALAARVPQTKDYRYAVANDRVLLVGTSRIVAGVFADANVPVSEGRRGP
jgi:Protein of unknown function (DUF1236)